MTIKQIIDLAKSEIGTHESPANSNNVKYNTWYYGREVHDHDVSPTITYPWCCVFISWLFRGTGLLKKTASCSDMLNYCKNNGLMVKHPQRGDIVFFKYKTNNRPTNHIGLVVSVSSDGKTINTIEGNTSVTSADNGGMVMQRNRYSNIVGYARPKYSDLISNDRPAAINSSKTQEDYDRVVKEVMRGKYGVQPERQKKLEAEGYDYSKIKDMVNKEYGK